MSQKLVSLSVYAYRPYADNKTVHPMKHTYRFGGCDPLRKNVTFSRNDW